MARIFRNTIYIDRDPNDKYKGWGWIQIAVDDCKQFEIPTGYPATYTNKMPGEGRKFPNNGNLPSRGKAGSKRLKLNLNGEIIELRVQKTLTIQAICSWLQQWAPLDTNLISSAGRVYSVAGDKVDNSSYFIYFILNEDSQAIKIGLAKDVEKRIETLQTSNPVKLELIKSIQVKSKKEAQGLEKQLHEKFSELRIIGEWFSAKTELLEHISALY